MTENKWGGKREGAGRKKIGNAILYARMNKCAVEDLKQRAKDANLAVGTYLVRELNLKQS